MAESILAFRENGSAHDLAGPALSRCGNRTSPAVCSGTRHVSLLLFMRLIWTFDFD